MLDVIRAERGEAGVANDAALDDDGAGAERSGLSRRLSRDEMEAILAERIEQMKQGGTEDAPTDQSRVFVHIVEQLEHGNKPLRLMIQASAGTGKSFLLTSVFLSCILSNKNAKACAPTGIAAGTQVGASTLHNTFSFDGSYTSKLDFSKTTTEKVAALSRSTCSSWTR